MKLAIMQPYFLPYIGYFQLIHSVDHFVVLDDVHFIKKGWINRNRIWVNNEAQYFSLPLEKPSQNKLIKETFLSPSFSEWKEKFNKTIHFNYQKSPYFQQGLNLLEKIFVQADGSISDLATTSLIETLKFLSLDQKVKISLSSELGLNDIRGQERIIQICLSHGTQLYHNLPGGRDLYQQKEFSKNDLSLRFIQSCLSNSNERDFLSILDLAMRFSKEELLEKICQYDLTE